MVTRQGCNYNIVSRALHIWLSYVGRVWEGAMLNCPLEYPSRCVVPRLKGLARPYTHSTDNLLPQGGGRGLVQRPSRCTLNCAIYMWVSSESCILSINQRLSRPIWANHSVFHYSLHRAPSLLPKRAYSYPSVLYTSVLYPRTI